MKDFDITISPSPDSGIRVEWEWVCVKDKLPPRDGTPFLCFDPWQAPLAKIYVVRFEENYAQSAEHYKEAGGEEYFQWKPTHWMPLPSLPKTEGS